MGDEKRLAALAKADEVRATHTKIRKTLSGLPRLDGLNEVARLLHIQDQRIERLEVGKLLKCCYRVGPTLVEWIYRRAQVSATRRVGHLTAGQRERLIYEVRRRANG